MKLTIVYIGILCLTVVKFSLYFLIKCILTQQKSNFVIFTFNILNKLCYFFRSLQFNFNMQFIEFNLIKLYFFIMNLAHACRIHIFVIKLIFLIVIKNGILCSYNFKIKVDIQISTYTILKRILCCIFNNDYIKYKYIYQYKLYYFLSYKLFCFLFTS